MSASAGIKRTIDEAQGQPWVESAGNLFQKIASALFFSGGEGGAKLRDALHGTWLGHPLHPVLTDVPVGAWSGAAVLDTIEAFTGNEELGRGADAAIAIGIAGATVSAITGLNDWQHTGGRAKRVGVLHATLNVIALLLYIVSFAMRRSGARGAGRAVAFLGFGVVSASGYLGGDLVFDERIGVDRSRESPLPRRFTKVMAEADLPEGQLHKAQTRRASVLLLKTNGQIYALADTCSHLGCSLSEGKLSNGMITCPCHGSTFSIEDGYVIHGPATFPQPVLETRVQEGQIEVRLAQR